MSTNTSNAEHPCIHCAATKELLPAPPLDSLIESNITKIIVLDFDGVLYPLSAGTLGKSTSPLTIRRLSKTRTTPTIPAWNRPRAW